MPSDVSGLAVVVATLLFEVGFMELGEIEDEDVEGEADFETLLAMGEDGFEEEEEVEVEEGDSCATLSNASTAVQSSPEDLGDAL